jgi:hypothetical protein
MRPVLKIPAALLTDHPETTINCSNNATAWPVVVAVKTDHLKISGATFATRQEAAIHQTRNVVE